MYVNKRKCITIDAEQLTNYNNFIQLCYVWSRQENKYLLIRRNPQSQSITNDHVALTLCPFTPISISYSDFNQSLCTYFAQNQTSV
jgi:hypothetical protein